MDDEPWKRQAICALVGPDLFHDDSEVPTALAVCEACPVQAQCIPVNLHEKDGVFGCTRGTRKMLRSYRARGATDQEVVLRARRANAHILGEVPRKLPVPIARYLKRHRQLEATG